MMTMINEHPVIPVRFGSEQKGMQTGGDVEHPEKAEIVWIAARDDAVRHAQRLSDLGVHKSICNRLTEPFMWITVIMTATEWKNFFRLRCHPDTEVHFQKIAMMCRDAINVSKPVETTWGNWHMPFLSEEEMKDVTLNIEQLKRVSVARCARVSYLTHAGKRDVNKDLELFQRLADGSGFGHYSPFEHVATPCGRRSGPFVGWKQFRKEFPLENSEG
jgi:hypothetical protein